MGPDWEKASKIVGIVVALVSCLIGILPAATFGGLRPSLRTRTGNLISLFYLWPPSWEAPNWRTSDQDGSAIDHYDLPSAEFFLHQEQIGFGYVMRFADPAHGQTGAHALKQVLPFCCCHVLPQVRPNNSGRHCIHANRRQLQGEGARQGFDGSANTGCNYPPFMRALPGNSCGEHD